MKSLWPVLLLSLSSLSFAGSFKLFSGAGASFRSVFKESVEATIHGDSVRLRSRLGVVEMRVSDDGSSQFVSFRSQGIFDGKSYRAEGQYDGPLKENIWGEFDRSWLRNQSSYTDSLKGIRSLHGFSRSEYFLLKLGKSSSRKLKITLARDHKVSQGLRTSPYHTHELDLKDFGDVVYADMRQVDDHLFYVGVVVDDGGENLAGRLYVLELHPGQTDFSISPSALKGSDLSVLRSSFGMSPKLKSTKGQSPLID